MEYNILSFEEFHDLQDREQYRIYEELFTTVNGSDTSIKKIKKECQCKGNTPCFIEAFNLIANSDKIKITYICPICQVPALDKYKNKIKAALEKGTLNR